MNVESTYHRYLKLTGEPGAAASLVLAEAMAGSKPETDELLSVSEAAGVMKVSPKTVYELCANGSLQHKKVGRQIRIRRADLDRVETPNQPSGARYW